ncbi:MAG: hypothetical protein FJ291_02120 [Planctomycetes bacterium]|nr:hypothetical protein [Planctomycetota bacterium]
MPDEAQLDYAAEQGRCLITFNTAHFTELQVRWLAEGQHHAGIVLSPQISLREFFRRCCALLRLYTPEMLRDQLIWLPRE